MLFFLIIERSVLIALGTAAVFAYKVLIVFITKCNICIRVLPIQHKIRKFRDGTIGRQTFWESFQKNSEIIEFPNSKPDRQFQVARDQL